VTPPVALRAGIPSSGLLSRAGKHRGSRAEPDRPVHRGQVRMTLSVSVFGSYLTFMASPPETGNWARPHVVTKEGGRPGRRRSQGQNPRGNRRWEGRYQERLGVSNRIVAGREGARGRTEHTTEHTSPSAPAICASDQEWGGRQRRVRRTTRGMGQPPGRWSGRGALGGWALRRGGPNGRGSAGLILEKELRVLHQGPPDGEHL